MSPTINAMTSSDFATYLALLIALAIAGFVASFVFLRRARAIEDTPTSKIRSAAQGYVELMGKARLIDGAQIYAPISHTMCAWYQYDVQKMGDKNNRRVDSGCSEELFYLVGNTGKCVVDPDGAAVTPSTKDVWYSSSYPCSVGRNNKGLFARLGARYRIVEKRIKIGGPLYAIGLFKTVGGANDSFKTSEEISHLLRQWKKDQAGMLEKFDKNNDGKIDAQEWDEVRSVATKQVKKEQRERQASPGVNVMCKPNERGRPYLLSAVAPEKLVKMYRLYAGSCFAAFLISSSIAVWMWGVR